MFSFSTAFFATLVAGATASLPLLVTYEPSTNVADHAAIAWDQDVIATQIGLKTEGSFKLAQAVYEEGGNSKSYARITLTAPLGSTLTKGTRMNIGTDFNGRAYSAQGQDSNTIEFQYDIAESYEDNVDCKVGGLPVDGRLLTGCIPESGTVTIEGKGPVTYVDFTTTDNKNGRTIQGFSTSAQQKFRPNKDTSQPFFSYFEPVFNYFGAADYADKIITAAFDSTSTDLSNGNVNMEAWSFAARGEVAKKVSAYVAVGQYVFYELFDATQDCSENCASGKCNLDNVNALDEAVAFYVGGKQPSDASGKGNLFYALAQKRMANFNTGDDGTKGDANANLDIMRQFNIMKTTLNTGKCADAVASAENIVNLMKIPVTQGTLRYGYLQTTTTTPTDKQMAEGMAFAIGVLPYVHACSADDAKIIYDNMSLKVSQQSSVDYAALKAAFERNYECMGISCEDVGGLYDSVTEDYYGDAKPCVGNANDGSDSGAGFNSVSLAIGVMVTFATLLM